MIELREYQKRILETAIQKNTLVILPTGTGKTIIAFFLIKERLKKYPEKKIFFLAPTKPLVQQHYKNFVKIFPEFKDKAISISGEIKPERREYLYKTAQIIFITPQTLNNDIIGGRVSFFDTSTIIIDEAHRAVKKYPYVFIIKKAVEQSRDLRILGLTASPGFNIDRIKEVIKNLYIEAIEIRTGKEPDIKEYMKKINIIKIDVDIGSEIGKIKELLDKAYRIRKDKIRDLLNINITKGKKEILELQEYLRKKLEEDPKNPILLQALSIVAEINKIEHARELVETQTLSTFLDYINNLEKRKEISRSQALINFLEDIRVKKAVEIAKQLVSKGIEHPKINTLLDIILRNKDKKILIFAQIRKTVDVIYENIKKFGVSVMKFTGKAEMKQKEQIRILRDFEEGKFNVLVSTSVGEEGIDIPKVDIVIFYEPVPSEIRYIQRRGRTGRTDFGIVYVLVTKKTRDEIFYWVAINKEKKMLRFIKRLKKYLKGELKEGISVNTSISRTYSDMLIHRDKYVSGIEKYLKREDENNSKSNIKEGGLYNGKVLDISKKTVPIIIADFREKESRLVSHLASLGVIVKLSNLDVGDYIAGGYIIERKTATDFVKSIIDGRLEKQLEKLKDKDSIIIIEGDINSSGISLNKNLLRSILLKIILDYKIPLIFSSSYIETADYIYLLSKRSEKIKNINVYKKEIDEEKIKINILKQIPGIGDKSAVELINRFKSIEKIINTNKAELSKIIGEKKAERLKKIFKE